MTLSTVNILVLVGMALWFLACVQVYRTSRAAAWLAAPTVASCLFLSGVTVALSVFVRGALWTAPLWVGVVLLALLHLVTARRAAGRTYTPRSRRQGPAALRPLAGDSQNTDSVF